MPTGPLKIKVFTPAGTVKYLESLGVPGLLAYLTMVPGGTLLLVWIETRWVALLLDPFIAGTIVLVHGKNGWLFSNKDGGWEYPAFWIVGACSSSPRWAQDRPAWTRVNRPEPRRFSEAKRDECGVARADGTRTCH